MKSTQQQQQHSNNDSSSVRILEFEFWLFEFKQIFFAFRNWKRVQHGTILASGTKETLFNLHYNINVDNFDQYRESCATNTQNA